MTDLDAMFHRVQGYQDALRRHRRGLGRESDAERRTRQRHRADALVHTLTGGRPVGPAFRKWALMMVQADEAPDAPGDPPEPIPPGARAALKPKPKKPTKNHNQEELF